MNIKDFNDAFKARGYKTILLKGKKPVEKGWQLPSTPAVAWIPDGSNIGVVLGGQSGGLVDLDIDSDEALPIADKFLPETGMEFGRDGRSRSHRLYNVHDAGRRKFITGPDGNMMIELRGEGHQTMFPGSQHPDGDFVRFDADGEPATSTWDGLWLAAQKLAIATVVLQHWVPGSKHELALAMAGLLRKAGWGQVDVAHLIEVIAEEARDNDVEDRLKAVETTFEADMHKVVGFTKLVTLIGEDVANWMAECAGVGKQELGGAERKGPVSLATDTSSSQAFVAKNIGRLTFCFENTTWYRKKNGVFGPISPAQVQGEALDFISNVEKDGLANFVELEKLKSAGRIRNMLELSRDALGVNLCELDKDDHLLGCRNGVLDLNERRLVDDASKIITKRAGVNYDPSAECPKFERFMDETFAGNAEVIGFMQRALGYALCGSTSEQAMLAMVGTGANGKSTLIEVFGSVLGEYYAVTPPQTLVVQKFTNDKNDDLANLVGKRFVAASELEAGAKLAVAKVKGMTGGDTIACRFLHSNQFTYRPQFLLVVGTNDLPVINETGEAIWRRILVVRFPVEVPKEKRNGNLSKELMEEGPGILKWALDGYHAWRLQKLNPPACVLDETASYRKGNDHVKQFVEEYCSLGDDSSFTATSDLHSAYNLWCRLNGVEAMPVSRFGKELPRFKCKPKKRRDGNGWLGISLASLSDGVM